MSIKKKKKEVKYKKIKIVIRKDNKYRVEIFTKLFKVQNHTEY